MNIYADFTETKSTILLVDDEKINLKVLSNLLKDDYVLKLAIKGEQALKLAQEAPIPDLIILDVLMPEMDGYQVIKLLKANEITRNIPVIFVTALNGSADEEQGLKLGAVDYITKPYSQSIVKIRVRNHLLFIRQFKLFENYSYIDGLTGIPNRRRFEEYFAQEFKRILRSQGVLSLAMLDIDYFKQYNDYYGHAAGDKALQQVAKLLQKNLKRSTDLVARYGGEEFVLVLPDTSDEQAVEIAHQILLDLSTLNIAHEFSSVAQHITLSIGIISCQPTNQINRNALLKQADQNLYSAKAAGRNRIIASQT